MIEALRLYEAVVMRVLIAGSFIMIVAGGLGMAATAGLIGLLLLPCIALPAARAALSQPTPLLFLAAAITWASISLIWSPYDRPDQVLKLTLLTPLFILAPFAVTRFSPDRREALFRWLAVGAVAAGGLFFVEALSGSWLSKQAQIHLNGVPATDDGRLQILADRVLGRGLSAYLMVAGPVAIGLWALGGLANRTAAVFMLIACATGSLSFGIQANALALGFAAIAAAAAYGYPQASLQIGLSLSAGLIIAAPLIMGAVISLMPPAALEALPLSWAMRIEIWRFAMEQIALAPVTGHGLDASRVISDIAELRGTQFDRLPLHAHNAGLTIWLETGAVGALLFGGALVAVSRSIGQARLTRVQAAAIAYAAMTFLTTVWVGSGIWQEWVHGSLAFGLAAALMIQR